MFLGGSQVLLLSLLLGAGHANARVLQVRNDGIDNAALDKRTPPSTTSEYGTPVLVIERTMTTPSLAQSDLREREAEAAASSANDGEVLESIVSVINSLVDGASTRTDSTVTGITTSPSRRSPSSSTSSAQNALDVLISAVSEELLGSETTSQISTRTRSASSTRTKSTSESPTTTASRPTKSLTRTSRPTDTSRPTNIPSDRPSDGPGRPGQTSLNPSSPSPTATASISSSKSGSPVSAASSSSTNALPPPPDPQEQDRKGRVAGIATGAIAGAAVIALAGAFLVRRHLQKKASASEKKGVYPEVAWLYDPAPTPSRPGSAHSGHSGHSRHSSIASVLDAPLNPGGFDAAAERRASAAPEVIPSMVDRHSHERQSRSTWPNGHDNSSVPLLAPIPAIASRESSPVGRSPSPGGSPTSRYSRRASRSRSSLDVSRRPLSAVYEESVRPISHIDR